MSRRRRPVCIRRNDVVGERQSKDGPQGQGLRNKISAAFLEALAEDFEQHGVDAIKIMRVEKPAEYVKVIASILPKELEITENRLAEIPDDELDFIIEYTRRQLAARLERNASREDAPLN
jgi:hypothetical protein